MAARATWKGFLKISLVNIPIKVFPATESAGTISFNQLHGECKTRISRSAGPHCNRSADPEIVKASSKEHYVVLTDEDFDKVRPESTRVIDLVQFADETSIDPMYVDRTYYLAPDGGVASEAFAVMRDGMAGKVGVGKLALYGREYLVAVKPQGRGIVMYTLHHAAEIRSIDQVDELNSVPTSVKPAEMKLAQQVISTFEGPLDLASYTDEYRAGLQQIIDAKIAGWSGRTGRGSQVVNLMERARKSLDTVTARREEEAGWAVRPRPSPRRRRSASEHRGRSKLELRIEVRSSVGASDPTADKSDLQLTSDGPDWPRRTLSDPHQSGGTSQRRAVLIAPRSGDRRPLVGREERAVECPALIFEGMQVVRGQIRVVDRSPP